MLLSRVTRAHCLCAGSSIGLLAGAPAGRDEQEADGDRCKHHGTAVNQQRRCGALRRAVRQRQLDARDPGQGQRSLFARAMLATPTSADWAPLSTRIPDSIPSMSAPAFTAASPLGITTSRCGELLNAISLASSSAYRRGWPKRRG